MLTVHKAAPGLVAALLCCSWRPDASAGPKLFRIIRVTPKGEGDGTSWATATSLQRLVDRAAGDEGAILNQCDEIWLSRGTHRLSKRLVANRDWHVRILGGFAGGYM